MHAYVYRVRLRGFVKCVLVAYRFPIILIMITEWKPVWSAILGEGLVLSRELNHQHWFQKYFQKYVHFNYFLTQCSLPSSTHCPRLTVFFSACPRVKGCVSPSLYTCHLLNLMTRTLTIHLTMMTKMMMTRKRLRRTSQTGHQWVHLSAHCLQSLLSPLFLSVKGSKTTHIKCSSE